MHSVSECTPLYVLLIVHPEGISTWATNDESEAFKPCFGPRVWEEALKLLPIKEITRMHVRVEAQAVAWPGEGR